MGSRTGRAQEAFGAAAQEAARAEPAGKAHRFELVEIPELFGPRELRIDEQRIKAFAFAQDDYCSWHFADSPFGGPVGHAALLANELMQLYFERYRIDVHEEGGGAWLEEAHVEETLWFRRPAFLGEAVAVNGRFVEKYVKDGHGAVVLEGDARAADGSVLMGHRAVEYFAMDGPTAAEGAPSGSEPPMRRVRPVADASLEPARSAQLGLSPGTPIPALEKTISFPQQLVFSTLDHPSAQRSVHTDLAIARRAGLTAPLVQGQQLACHVSEAMTRFFGAAWYLSGWVRLKFLGQVCAGERITVGGAVHGDASRKGVEVLELDVWVRGESGAAVAVGNACAAPLGTVNRPAF